MPGELVPAGPVRFRSRCGKQAIVTVPTVSVEFHVFLTMGGVFSGTTAVSMTTCSQRCVMFILYNTKASIAIQKLLAIISLEVGQESAGGKIQNFSLGGGSF